MINFIKNNYLALLFIVSSLINSALLLLLTTGYNNITFLLFDLLILLLISSFSFLIKRRNLYFLIWSFILVFICCLNSFFYNSYNDFVTFSLFETMFQSFKLPSRAVTDVFEVVDFIFIWQNLLFIFLYRNKKYDVNLVSFKRIFTCFFALLASLLLICDSNDIYRLKHEWNKVYVARNFGIYTHQLNDIFHIGYRLICPSCGSSEAIKKITSFYQEKPKASENEYTGIFKNKNIIFIHAESVQSMFLNTKINGQEITPNLNHLVNNGLYFSNFYSQESVGRSSDTEFTISNSILPVSMGTVFVNYDNNNYDSMIKSFKENGYYTFSMHGNVCDYWNRDVMYQELGYDHFYCYDQYDLQDKIGLGLSDKSFFNQSADMIKEISSSYDHFYGTLIMLSNHSPFDTNNKIQFDVSYLEGTRIGNYLKLLHYADDAIGEFINKLDYLGILDDTVIVIYGDHDASFTVDEYEFYLHDDLDFYEYEKLTRVPLIIYTKDQQFNKTIDKVMGTYDVMPTLANMFNFDVKHALGHDIFSIDENIVVFPNGNWLTDKVYYNNQLSEYEEYDDVSEDYLKEKETYAKMIVEISNDLVRYNLTNQPI